VQQSVDVGSEIGGYRVESFIGRGGMGEVYRAEHPETGKKAAVKLLSPELARTEGFRQRFVRESRYVGLMNHPNIVNVYESGEDDGLLYMAMEFIEGTDLKHLLAKEGPLQALRAISILTQVAHALDAAHSTGLLHRDVKPGNIMVGEGDSLQQPEHVCLTDFGLSKRTSSDSLALTAAGEFVGTIDYTAPEQVLGKNCDHRVDVYALGCVLFECLTGHPPFQKERDVEILYAHIQDPPPKATAERSEVPAGIDEVIAKAMAKMPDDRYGSCTELIEAATAVVGAPPPPPAPPPPSTEEILPLRLRVMVGNRVGSVISLDREEFLIGRHAPGEGKLDNDIEISREHARVTRDEFGRYVIEDLGSTNGTYVNDTRIGGPQVLALGDRIEVGQTTLEVVPGEDIDEEGAESEPSETMYSELPSNGADQERRDASTPASSQQLEAQQQPSTEEKALTEDKPSTEEKVRQDAVPPTERFDIEASMPVSLQVELDPPAGKLTIRVDGGDAVRLVRRDGEWLIDPEA
jgi:serine/threonine protein kinase